MCWTQTGDWLPASGAASREIALNFGWTNLPQIWTPKEPELFDPAHVPWGFHADVATRQLFLFLFEHPLLVPLRANVSFFVWPQLGLYAPYRAFTRHPAAGIAVVLVVVAVGAALISRSLRRCHPAAAERELGRLLVAYLVATFTAYSVFSPSHWYFTRYLTTPIQVSR